MTTFATVAVIGFETVGRCIAQVFAQNGRTVIVLEADQERIDNGLAIFESALDQAVARGELTPEEKNAKLSHLRWTTDVTDLADADLVVEAVSDNLQEKTAVLAQVAKVVHKDTVIATSTSALSISELANSVPEQARFAGLHFFNPSGPIKVIEIVSGQATGNQTTADLQQLVEDTGRVPIPVKDRPGFLINKLFMPYINDVIQALDDELASAEDIDVAIKLGLGYKMGPLELVDSIGLDIHELTTRGVYEATLDPAYAPPPLLQAMVAAGMKGNKNNKGFRTKETK